jgi:hypothetical protein
MPQKLRKDDKLTVISRIRHAVLMEKSLAEPFSARDIRLYAKGWRYGQYNTFLSNHTLGKSAEAFFVKVDRGKYRLLNDDELHTSHWD